MDDEVRASLPVGVDPLEAWIHAGVGCAVGAVGGTLFGLARIRRFAGGWAVSTPDPSLEPQDRDVLSPQNMGDWVAFPTSHLSAYWSPEVLSRVLTPSSSDLVGWDVAGHTWAIAHVRAEVDEFVDAILREVPSQREPGTTSGTEADRSAR
jgi:hypothetical protein